jgi:hypothetical protein
MYFCDISLDYIKIYEPVAADLLCDRMEEMIAQNRRMVFHLLTKRLHSSAYANSSKIAAKLAVTWWTNIRFENFKDFVLASLKHLDCIPFLEVLKSLPDRLLKLIDKGVTVEQVAKGHEISPKLVLWLRIFNVWLSYPNHSGNGEQPGNGAII